MRLLARSRATLARERTASQKLDDWRDISRGDNGEPSRSQAL